MWNSHLRSLQLLNSLLVAYAIISSSKLFRLICSLPLLEHLAILGPAVGDDGHDKDFKPVASPPLTGTLALHLSGGPGHTIRQLVGLPNGVRFRDFGYHCFVEEELRWMSVLAEACSDTLERVEIERDGTFLLLLRWDKH
jgi:hypothetical protein